MGSSTNQILLGVSSVNGLAHSSTCLCSPVQSRKFLMSIQVLSNVQSLPTKNHLPLFETRQLFTCKWVAVCSLESRKLKLALFSIS